MCRCGEIDAPADKGFVLIAQQLEGKGLWLQAVLAEHLHGPHQCCPAGLVIVEQISS